VIVIAITVLKAHFHMTLWYLHDCALLSTDGTARTGVKYWMFDEK
jgi:hypothetical protein